MGLLPIRASDLAPYYRSWDVARRVPGELYMRDANDNRRRATGRRCGFELTDLHAEIEALEIELAAIRAGRRRVRDEIQESSQEIAALDAEADTLEGPKRVRDALIAWSAFALCVAVLVAAMIIGIAP
jgi:septal ring factor EnvC (AmiA/AmiB activator)